jgi:ABC-type transport system involved in multi-copper enzyme maturation permease subunit
MTLLDRIGQFSPFGPVVAGELRSGSRRRRNYVLRVVYLAVLFLVLFVWWAGSRDRGYGPTNVAYLAQQQAELGEEFFATFSIFSVIAMALICPILTSSAINVERRRKTLGVLLITPISAWQIVSGKLFARLLTAMCLLGLSLPVVALVRLEGSVEVSQILIGIALATATAISCGALGLLYSVMMDQPAMVILMSYLSLACLYGLTAVIAALTAALDRPGNGALWLLGIDPIVQIVFLLSPRGMAGMGIDWIGCVAIQLGLAMLFLTIAAARLRREMQDADILDGLTPRQAGKALKKALKEKSQTPPPLPSGSLFISDAFAEELSTNPDEVVDPSSPAPSSQSTTRDVGDWPVLWRECRAKLFGPRRNAMLFAIFLSLALLAGYVLSDWRGMADVQTGFAIAFNVVICLAATVISATMMTQEKESGAWPLLIATPISGRQIVLSKTAGVGRRMLVLTMLLLAHFLLIGPLLGAMGVHLPMDGSYDYADDSRQGVATMWAPSLLAVYVIVTFNSVWVATGIFFSTRMNRTTTAVVCNFLLLFAVFAGVPLLAAAASFGNRGDGFTFFLWYFPYFYMVELFQSVGMVTLPSNNGGVIGYDQFVIWTLAVGLIHLAIAGLILRGCGASFDRVTGRAPQTQPLPPAGEDDVPVPAE